MTQAHNLKRSKSIRFLDGLPEFIYSNQERLKDKPDVKIHNCCSECYRFFYNTESISRALNCETKPQSRK